MTSNALSVDDYTALDGLALAEAVARRETTAVAVLDRALEQAARLNPQINALDTMAPEVARERAARIDAELEALPDDAARLATLQRRPFLGVPLPLKDLGTACVDLPASMGSAFFRLIRFERDSELVLRHRAAGFIPFARSTSPELGLNPSTEATVYGGPTRNPFNLAHSSGGSSGGAAASVAAGIVPLAHATDGLGSIRIPASCCGLVGLKPTRGLMPAGPFGGESWGGLATEHVVSRSVRDSAAALDLTAGADEGAPYAAPPIPAGGYLAAVQAAVRGEMPRLRIALLDHAFDGSPVHPEIAAAVNRLARLLEGLGHVVERAAPTLDVVADMLMPALEIVASGTTMTVDARAAALGRAPREDELSATIHGAIEVARGVTGARYLKQLGALHAVSRRMAAFWRDHDVLLTPMLAQPPVILGRFNMTRRDFIAYRTGADGIAPYSPFAPLANITGQPAISVPAGMTAQGLPIGAQFVGRFGADATMLALAAEVEVHQPWANVRPTLR